MDMMRVRPLAGLVTGWLTMFVIGTDLFVISPLLPMIAADYRVSPAVAGLSVTVFALTYMVSAPLFGHTADRIGRRPVLIFCLTVFAIANLLTAAAAGLFWLLAARLLAGAAAAGVSPAVYALVGSAAPPDRRATWMALVVSGLLVSLALGAPIGAWAGALFGWMPVFAALAVLSLCLIWPNSRIWLRYQGTANAAGIHLQSLPTLLVIRRLMPMLLWSTGLYGMYTYLGVGLAAAGFSTGETARAILFYGCGAIAGVLLGGRLADRLGARLTAALSFVGLSACFLTLALAVHAGIMVEFALALTSGVAQLFFPAQQAGLANDFPSRRATMLAWNNSALFFGITLGSLVGGQAVAFAGFEASLVICAGIALLGCMITGIVVPPPARVQRADHPA
jgi:MFS transporter, DHA1 family, putative efflux transporter